VTGRGPTTSFACLAPDESMSRRRVGFWVRRGGEGGGWRGGGGDVEEGGGRAESAGGG
jgi:hypothetical protein